MKKFDVVVLGGGPGGYPAAIKAAQMGKSVALIESAELGGTCLNRGCIPSKALIAGGRFLAGLNEAPGFGIEIEKVFFHFEGLMQHKDEVVQKMREGLQNLIAAHKITLFKGFGKFISPFELKIIGDDSDVIRGDRVIIATGSSPKNIKAFPCDGEKILDSTALLSLKKLPKSLLVIGGGVIGSECASLYAHLGSQVTLVELLPNLLPMEAKEISDILASAFRKRGIVVKTGTSIAVLNATKNGVEAKTNEGEILSADCCLVSVGRSLNTHGIGLENTAIVTLEGGFIKVNEQMETTVSGVYAVGDITSKWQLAHVATHQGLIAAENACGGHKKMSYEAIPSVVFTDPEIASVGLSLEEALARGIEASAHAFPFRALGKAQAIRHTEGFSQMVIDKKSHALIGAQAVGHEASLLIAEMTVCIANGLTSDDLSETIHAHPTFSESWGETAALSLGFPLHILSKKRGL